MDEDEGVHPKIPPQEGDEEGTASQDIETEKERFWRTDR